MSDEDWIAPYYREHKSGKWRITVNGSGEYKRYMLFHCPDKKHWESVRAFDTYEEAKKAAQV